MAPPLTEVADIQLQLTTQRISSYYRPILAGCVFNLHRF